MFFTLNSYDDLLLPDKSEILDVTVLYRRNIGSFRPISLQIHQSIGDASFHSKTTTRKQKIDINLEIRYGLCSIKLISRHSEYDIYSTMRDIFEFNHIDPTLSKEKVKLLKDLYTHYHKKHYGYEKLHRGFRRKNFVCVIFQLAS